MIGVVSTYIVRFFIQRKALFGVVMCAIVGVLLFGASNLVIEKDLYAVLPDGKEHLRFNEIIQKNNLNKQVVFSLELNDDEEGCIAKAEVLVATLQKKFRGKLSNLSLYQTVDEQQLMTHLQASSILLLTTDDYHRIQKQLTTDSIQQAIDRLNERMQGMRGFFMRDLYSRDPLGLLSAQLTSLNPNSEKQPYTVRDGIIFTRDEQKILFLGTVVPDLKNSDELASMHKELNQFIQSFNSRSRHKLDAFGTFQIAAENAIQVQKDTWLTLLISVGGILLLLILYYKSLLAPLYFMLPAVFGMLCGAGLSGFIQPNISGISLATSSVLLGIVLDYSFHFFTHYKHSNSVYDTVRAISSPMIVGSFTTIAALGALRFTDSVVLQDFGLIALFTLSGSVVFTLWLLPALIAIFHIRLKKGNEVDEPIKKKQPLFIRFSVILFGLGTAYFMTQLNAPTFDADLNNLSFHTPELQAKEKAFTGINPRVDKKLFIVCSAANEEHARMVNWNIYNKIRSIQPSFGIQEVLSTAPYLIPEKIKQEGANKWRNFWKSRQTIVQKEIKQASIESGFAPDAFNPFYSLMNQPEGYLGAGDQLATDIGLKRLIYKDSVAHFYFSSVVLPRKHVDAFKQSLRSVDGAYVIDIADVTNTLVSSVKDDFNYLLLFSALIVFVSLLVVYGRIELALFAFLPMVLGWIWIIGVTHLAGISFNFVNIVIATFIFGLGDDFSIFTTDGLIQQYKTGIKVVRSYQSAIVLSAVTTIVGTGALYFAKHPAIHSIALISVLGIGIILFITLYIQPQLFYWFVLNRHQKNKVPVTFFTLIYSCGLFLYFFLGSIVLNIFLIFILYPFPAPKHRKRALLNFLVSKLAKSTIYAGIHVKKRIHYPDKLQFSQPSVIVANHSSFLDILLVIMLHPKAIIMVKSWVYNSPIFGLFIRYAGYPFAEEGTETNLDIIRQRVAEGYSIVLFPEGTRSTDGEIKRFHKGAFHLAKELHLAIQPILLIGAHEVNPKNDLLINRGELHVVPLDRLTSDQDESTRDLTKRVNRLMREALIAEKQRIAKSQFWSAEIIKNYVFKGPILEWYVRIKWRLEQHNYDVYDEQIAQRKRIYDIGCGYGYLSYYLHYRNVDRHITGIDYDQEKIDVAEHARKKKNTLHFECADARMMNYDKADVFFINDVLHYLPKDDQYALLQQLHNQLLPDGILFIRDGIENDAERHRNTRFTEWLSTKVFKFNKTTNALHFLNEIELREFASHNGLSIERIQHSKTTSNALFILRKKS